ncbi:hypothetical protein PIB30_056988 [Stylosanthes scabra]|uniref:Uncharacterized protein n=1 Tax=Stylosanthes scabra TaxID=79078 RepID=A0ABU6UIA5_9FABA|nr:hypothetical protein [Stylosanthes scabra]
MGDVELEGPSDRVSFRAEREDVLSRCKVVVSQLHLNGWGFLRTFERVCLHFGFCPTSRLFLYIYDVLFLPSGKGYVFFRAHQGRKLLGSYEESIQEFKWHYFKVLPSLGKRLFWLDDEGNPFSWVYWNPKVKDFSVHNLDLLETAACNFLLSLPAGLPKKNNFNCRWILDHIDDEVKKFLDSLLSVKMKQNKHDYLMAMLADPWKMAYRATLSLQTLDTEL